MGQDAPIGGPSPKTLGKREEKLSILWRGQKEPLAIDSTSGPSPTRTEFSIFSAGSETVGAIFLKMLQRKEKVHWTGTGLELGIPEAGVDVLGSCQ